MDAHLTVRKTFLHFCLRHEREGYVRARRHSSTSASSQSHPAEDPAEIPPGGLRRTRSSPSFPVSLKFTNNGAVVSSSEVDGEGNCVSFLSALPSVGSLWHSPGNCTAQKCFWARTRKGCKRGWLCNCCHFCASKVPSPFVGVRLRGAPTTAEEEGLQNDDEEKGTDSVGGGGFLQLESHQPYQPGGVSTHTAHTAAVEHNATPHPHPSFVFLSSEGDRQNVMTASNYVWLTTTAGQLDYFIPSSAPSGNPSRSSEGAQMPPPPPAVNGPVPRWPYHHQIQHHHPEAQQSSSSSSLYRTYDYPMPALSPQWHQQQPQRQGLPVRGLVPFRGDRRDLSSRQQDGGRISTATLRNSHASEAVRATTRAYLDAESPPHHPPDTPQQGMTYSNYPPDAVGRVGYPFSHRTEETVGHGGMGATSPPPLSLYHPRTQLQSPSRPPLLLLVPANDRGVRGGLQVPPGIGTTPPLTVGARTGGERERETRGIVSGGVGTSRILSVDMNRDGEREGLSTYTEKPQQRQRGSPGEGSRAESKSSISLTKATVGTSPGTRGGEREEEEEEKEEEFGSFFSSLSPASSSSSSQTPARPPVIALPSESAPSFPLYPFPPRPFPFSESHNGQRVQGRESRPRVLSLPLAARHSADSQPRGSLRFPSLPSPPASASSSALSVHPQGGAAASLSSPPVLEEEEGGGGRGTAGSPEGFPFSSGAGRGRGGRGGGMGGAGRGGSGGQWSTPSLNQGPPSPQQEPVSLALSPCASASASVPAPQPQPAVLVPQLYLTAAERASRQKMKRLLFGKPNCFLLKHHYMPPS